MNIPLAVNKLLMYHDCVIVPGLGGFFTKYVEANINLKKQELTPPSKQIAFNKNIASSDNLLLNYICTQKNISRSEAEQIIQNFVDKFYKHLEINKTFNFGELGDFILKDEELIFNFSKNLNLLISAFGLSKFNYPVLKEHKENQLKTIMETKTQKETSGKKSRTLARVLGVAAIIVGFLFASIYFDILKIPELSDSIQTASRASFNVFDGKHSVSPDEQIIKIENLIKKSDEEETEEEISYEDFDNNLEAIGGFRNHIIAGSFSVQSNAVKLRDSLISSGFNAKIFHAPNEMHRVSVQSFSSKNEANIMLPQLKQELNMDELWVCYI